MTSFDSIKKLQSRMSAALAAYGRGLVASLTGDHWIARINPVARLANFSDEQVAGLQEAVFYWIRKHHHPSRDKS